MIEILTVKDLAVRLRVRPRTVQEWARKGRIPTVRLSAKVIRFDWAAVVAAISSRSNQSEAIQCPR